MPVVLFVLGFVAGGLFFMGAIALALMFPFPFADPNKFVYTPSRRRRIIGFSVFSLAMSMAILFMVPGVQDGFGVILGLMVSYLCFMVSPGSLGFLLPEKQQE